MSRLSDIHEIKELYSYISEKKPKITESSVKCYSSNIISLYRKMHNDSKLQPSVKELVNFFIKNVTKVLSFLNDNSIATILSSILVLCTEHQSAYIKYKEQMLSDRKTYDDENKEQKKSATQEKNWISQHDIQLIYNESYKKYSPLFKLHSLKNKDKHNLIDLIILSLYVLLPPRRLKDYALMKVKNINKDKDNYVDDNNFVFQQYKTSKYYGTQIIPIPRKLKIILDAWSKFNTSDYLIPNHKYPNQPLTISGLHTRINNIFDNKHISVNILRHSYISETVLPNVPKLTKLEKVAEEMGNSVNQQILYKKY